MPNTIVIPENLGNTPTGRPFVHFHIKPSQGGDPLQGDIFLPIPAGESFEDGGSYSTIDMGTQAIKLDADRGNMVLDVAKAQINDLTKNSAAKLLPQNGAEIAMASNRRVLNPNTNTTFEGNNVRSFTFGFTLVGRTPGDTNQIKALHELLRSAIYPFVQDDGSNILLSYPPTWDVKFVNSSSGGGENKWLPKIYECYLTGLNTTFNPSALMFKTDMSPVETEISITMQETRALTRKDV